MQDRTLETKHAAPVRSRATRSLARHATSGLITVGLLGALGAGCLSRPVEAGTPTTKDNFSTTLAQNGIDKVDLLFAIDNSASMGDKQALLAAAVPDLVTRLFTPNCVDEVDLTTVVGVASADGTCAKGKAEFPPVHDMHIGIVSSSLGGRGSDACAETGKQSQNPVNPALSAHNNDAGHLLNRIGDNEIPSPDAGSSNFLAWLPQVTANNNKPAPPANATRLTDSIAFTKDFTDLVTGVHQYGCGFEAQLESMYRFLIQPDPYQSITLNGRVASLTGIDGTVLQQRHDFLRPDSLVAVIMITDENDSAVDPLSLGGQGWQYLNSTFNGNATVARGTKACDADPNSPACSSCAFTTSSSDPNCAPGDSADGLSTNGYYKVDKINVRPILMKKRFGYDPQFPVSRYINGFTSKKVPNQAGEHSIGADGVPQGYVGTNKCTNPLFALTLPTDPTNTDALCNMTVGTRTPDSVFFAVIGGVPWQLLSKNPATATTANPALKDSLTSGDWDLIVGKDPARYNYSGQDPHMIESFAPRAGLQPITASDTADPYNGREWDTVTPTPAHANGDLQLACTFELYDATAKAPIKRDCKDPQFASACDCDGSSDIPVCDATVKTTQIRGKAYPTIREFSVVRALGNQGIISSICPIVVEDNTSPYYGYRPAVKSIIDRLKNALAGQCLPHALTADATGNVPCLILETLGTAGDESVCNDATNYPGRSIPDAAVLARVRTQQRADKAAGGPDVTGNPVCQIKQLTDVAPGQTCTTSTENGWCYVVNTSSATPAGSCPQAIQFSPTGAQKAGSTISLQCILQSTSGDDGGAATTTTADGG